MSNPSWDDTAPAQAPAQASGAPSWDDTQDLEDKYGGVGGAAKAFGAGAARGASFGLSDQAMTKSGLVKPETLKGLQEQNPGSSIAGELTGVVAPALVGDEASLANLPGAVGKIGGAVERGATKALEGSLGKTGTSIASHVAGMGSEGAIYGLGQAVSENALGDHDLISQQTLADVGWGAALAGSLGGLIGGYKGAFARGAEDLSSAEDKILAQRLTENVDSASPAGALLSNNLPASEKLSLIEALRAQKGNAKEITDAGELIGAPVLPAQTSSSKYIQDATSSLSKTPSIPGVITQQAIQKGYDAVDGTIKGILGAGEQLSAYDAGSLIKEQVQKVADQIYEPLRLGYKAADAENKAISLPDKSRLKLWENLQDLASKTGSVGSDGSKLVEGYAERALAQDSGHQMEQLIQEIGDKQNVAYRSGDTKVSMALGDLKESLNEFLEKEIEKQGRAAAKEMGPEAEELFRQKVSERRDLKAKYSDFKEILGDLASDQRLGKKANTFGRLGGALDSLPNEKVIDRMFDPKNADGLARLKKNFPEAFETLIEQKKSQILQGATKDGKVQIGKVLNQIYDEKRLSSKVREAMFSPDELKKLNASKTWIESLPKDLNPSGTSMAEAYRELLTNPIKATVQNFTGYATKALIEKFASNPQEAAQIMTLANTQKAAMKTEKRVYQGIADILGKTVRGASEKVFSKITSADDYKDKTKDILNNVNNMNAFQDKLNGATNGMYAHAPQITQGMQQSMVLGMQFLASKIPQNAPAGIFQKEAEPSSAQVAQFKRYYDVVQDPLLALKQVKQGTIVPETVETLNAVYPHLYQHMKEQMISQLGTVKSAEMPYNKKLAISQFMGEPLDPSMTFQGVMLNQQSFQGIPEPQAPQKKKRSPLGGLKEISVADRTGISQESNI